MGEVQALLYRLLSLSEAGRMISSANLAAIKAAADALSALIAKAEGGTDAPSDAETKKATESARELLEADLSFSDTTRALQMALKAANPNGKAYYWVRDCFDDWFVYEDDGPDGAGASKLYKRTYVIADDGAVTLGDPVEVQQRTEYVAVGAATEAADVEVAGDLVPLVERAVRRDSTVPIKIIAPGWGSSGYYGAEMLERDGPKVFTKGLKMFWDHPTAAEEAERPERSLRDLAGEFTSDARWEPKGKAGPGLYADAKVFSPYKEALDELGPHIGVSIRALGKGKDGEAEGRKGKVIESLVAAKSTDFVTAAGAGGQIAELFESARSRASIHKPEEGSEVTEAEAQALREANTAAVGRIADLERRLLEADAERFVREQLAAVQLPDAARARLAASLVERAPVKDGALDREAFAEQIKEAAAAEAKYIASVAPNPIRGMGSAPAEELTAEESEARLTGAFQRLGLSESTAKLAANGRG